MAEILRNFNHWHTSFGHPNRCRVMKHMRRDIFEARCRSNPAPKRLVYTHNLIAVELNDVTTQRDAFCLKQLVINFVSHRHRRAPLDLTGRLTEVDQGPVEINTVPCQFAYS